MSPDPTPEVLLEHADWVAALAARLVSDPGQADDLVQTTWLEALRTRPGEIRNPRAWLGAVVRNAARQWRRGEDRRRRREESAAEREAWPSAAELVERANLQREVVGRVVDLDEPYRTTVLLRFFEGLPQREIAVRMGCPVATVNTRLQRALTRLRERLDGDYGDRETWSAALLPLLALAGPRAARVALPGGAVAGALAAAGVVAGAWIAGVAVTRGLGGGPEGEVALVVPPERTRPPGADAAPLVMPERTREIAPAPEAEPRRALGGPEEVRVTEWPQLHGGPEHANLRAQRDAILFPRILWHVPDAVGQPVVSGDDLYAVGAGLQRLDARTGRVLAWRPAELGAGASRETAGPAPEGAPAEADEDRSGAARTASSAEASGDAPPVVFAGAPAVGASAVIARCSDGAVVAWDRGLDHELWRRPLDPPAGGEARPGVLAGDLYVCASGGVLLGLAADTGRTRWTWRAEDGAAVHVTPAVAEERVLFGTTDGQAVALELATGVVAWQRELVPGLVAADPVAVGERLVLADRGVRGERRGALHALALEDGEPAWTYVYGGMELATPGVGEGLLFSHATREVTAVDLATGEAAAEPEQRTGRASGASPLLVGSTLYSADREGFLYARSLERGELAWAFWVPGGAIDRFAHVDGRLYVTTSQGLYALGDEPDAGRLPRGHVLRADAR